jgi:hypothetical protein
MSKYGRTTYLIHDFDQMYANGVAEQLSYSTRCAPFQFR